jgi:HD-GYP domain-containing protein (c-di-GMP phosphodiesterase class II)
VNRAHRPYRRLVAALFGTLKLVQMYGRGHDATGDALRNLTDAVVEAASGGGEVVISVRGRRLQVNGRPMRTAECGTLALTFLAAEWIKRGIEHVHLRPSVEVEDLAVFAGAFLELDLSQPDPVDRLVSACALGGAKGITIERRTDEPRDPILLEERRETAMHAYLRGLRAFKEVLRGDGMQDRSKLRRARRAVQSLVDTFLEDETAVLALAQIRGHDVKLFHHSLNVCIQALLIGQRLGMTRRQLGELGLAALFHDLGKTIAQPDTGEGEPPTPPDPRTHPSRGARLLLQEATAHEGMLKAAIAAYEHHVHYDRTGFPDVGYTPHLVSRIVAIADCYETLTSSHTYTDVLHTPYDALFLMQSKAGTLFDPLLFKVFVNAVGIYPVGSLVKLTSGEYAIVAEGPADPTFLDQPKVRIVKTAEGTLEPSEILDLAERSDDETTAREIAGAAAPHEIFENVAEYVSAI